MDMFRQYRPFVQSGMARKETMHIHRVFWHQLLFERRHLQSASSSEAGVSRLQVSAIQFPPQSGLSPSQKRANPIL